MISILFLFRQLMNPKQYLVLDTNILVSAVLSKTSKARQALDKAQNKCRIYIPLTETQQMQVLRSNL